ncbi:30S ribosomal protein S13 [Candidatus Micrarchaeota archaeon]|nr:30S ribosomal protein S13 [Candidatus Micrarchaeota archaeon]
MSDKNEKKQDKQDKKGVKKSPVKKEPRPEKKAEKITKGIKRIAGKDVSGDYRLHKALLRVRGIGKGLNRVVASIISKALGVPKDIQVGDLTDVQMEEIDKILVSLEKQGVPEFMLNRRKDFIDGTSKHVIMNDLIFAVKQDVDREKNSYTWKGYRHAYGQKTRGQRTRNTGRVGMTVGVLRKAVLAQTKGAAPGAGAQAAKTAEKKG